LIDTPTQALNLKALRCLSCKKACETAKEAARHIPDRLIGWDVAITTTGPTIIEGNEDPHLFMSDVAYG
jgi:hypothetical protein